MKTFVLYLLLAITASMLSQQQTCTMQPTEKEKVVYKEAKPDTVTKWVYKETFKTKVIRVKDTTGVMGRDSFLSVDTVYFRKDNQRVIVYDGQVNGEKCQYHYNIGIAKDSIQFMQLASDCAVVDTTIIEQVILPPAQIIQMGAPFEMGAVGSYEFNSKSLGIGIHARYRALYGGVDVSKAQTTVRAGFLFGKKNK